MCGCGGLSVCGGNCACGPSCACGPVDSLYGCGVAACGVGGTFGTVGGCFGPSFISSACNPFPVPSCFSPCSFQNGACGVPCGPYACNNEINPCNTRYCWNTQYFTGVCSSGGPWGTCNKVTSM